ncbi:MAG TPA: SCP2 sterol-binding domain-containing protein [Gaiellaceae bacterium]|nr:SCP2 sterol-binding domain-containing protein [Gaiellaceae bacterium]
MARSARELFEGLGRRSGPTRARGLTASYRFDVEGAGSWRIEVDDGAVFVEESAAAADCVISTSEETLLRIVRGEESPIGAYFAGKVKVAGDVGLALRLGDLLA